MPTRPRLTERRSPYIAACLFLLIGLALVLRLAGLQVDGRTFDEIRYTNYAHSFMDHGMRGTKALVASYNGDPKSWILPLPTRVGYYALLSFTMRMTGLTDTGTGAYLSIFFSLLALIVVFRIGIRFFSVWTAVAGALYLAVSPLDLAICRRTWQDSLMFFLFSLMIYCGAEMLSRSKNFLWSFAFVFLAAYSVWIKESSWAASGFCVLWVSGVFAARKERRLALAVFFASVFAMAGSFLLLARLSGGFSAIAEMFRHVQETVPKNDYAIDYQDGPWWHFIWGMWLLSPVSLVLFFTGAGYIYAASDDPKKEGSVLFLKNRSLAVALLVLLIALAGILSLPAYFKNLRYLSPFYGAYYLVAGLGVSFIARMIGAKPLTFHRKITALCLMAALVWSLGADYVNFRTMFIKGGAYDLVVRQFLEEGRSKT